jgi:HSP20 family protein
MDLAKWDPFRELEDVSERLNRFFGRSLIRGGRETGKETMTSADWAPAVDITETDKEYVIKAAVPEVKKEDVKVSIEEGMLMLQGERKHEKEEKGKKFHRIEQSYGTFVRSFQMPDDAEQTKVKAEFKDGMMYITLPKSEKAKPKAIEVKVQ